MIKRGDIQLAVTTEILYEYEEQLADFYTPVVADGVLQILDTLENVHSVRVFFKWNLITADSDDNKFSDCAVATGADYLVTYDRHFLVLADIEFPKIICVTLEELKALVESQMGS